MSWNPENWFPDGWFPDGWFATATEETAETVDRILIVMDMPTVMIREAE